MSKYTERALLRRRQMRPDGRPVYNCCQTVACCFAEELGYDEDAAMKTATFFRGGMQMGSVCGAITGALMVLGLAGLDDTRISGALYAKLREKHNGLVNCRDLLRVNAEQGGDKFTHCNAMICECIDAVEAILRDEGKL